MTDYGDINGKYTAFKVPDHSCGPEGWFIGKYVGPGITTHTARWPFADRVHPRVGKVVSINGNGMFRTVIIEHPWEWLERQSFPEYEVNHRPAPHGGRYAR